MIIDTIMTINIKNVNAKSINFAANEITNVNNSETNFESNINDLNANFNNSVMKQMLSMNTTMYDDFDTRNKFFEIAFVYSKF